MCDWQALSIGFMLGWIAAFAVAARNESKEP